MSNEFINIDSANANSSPEHFQLRYISISKYEGDWQSLPHTHHFSELFYVLRGEGAFYIAVSYTHLDVYKRQDYAFFPNLILLSSFPCSSPTTVPGTRCCTPGTIQFPYSGDYSAILNSTVS